MRKHRYSLVHAPTGSASHSLRNHAHSAQLALADLLGQLIRVHRHQRSAHCERRTGTDAGSGRHVRVDQDLQAFWLGHLAVQLLVCGQHCLVAAQEVVEPVVALFELLERVCGDLLARELVLVDVVDLDHVLVVTVLAVRHHEILF